MHIDLTFIDLTTYVMLSKNIGTTFIKKQTKNYSNVYNEKIHLFPFMEIKIHVHTDYFSLTLNKTIDVYHFSSFNMYRNHSCYEWDLHLFFAYLSRKDFLP